MNHDSHDAETLALAGQTRDGRPVHLARDYVEADRRIVLGFIEPHFMAGFSGGYKGVFPAIADIDAIMHYHRAEAIGHPQQHLGRAGGQPHPGADPLGGRLLPVDFLVNVTLNRKRQITRFFCGEVLAAHARRLRLRQADGHGRLRAALSRSWSPPTPAIRSTRTSTRRSRGCTRPCRWSSRTASSWPPPAATTAFPATATSSSCCSITQTPRALLDTIMAPGFSVYDQWEAQLLAIIALQARVGLKSELDPAEVRRAHLEPVADIGARVAAELDAARATCPSPSCPRGP